MEPMRISIGAPYKKYSPASIMSRGATRKKANVHEPETCIPIRFASPSSPSDGYAVQRRAPPTGHEVDYLARVGARLRVVGFLSRLLVRLRLRLLFCFRKHERRAARSRSFLVRRRLGLVFVDDPAEVHPLQRLVVYGGHELGADPRTSTAPDPQMLHVA